LEALKLHIFGAHMRGFPLNGQILELGGQFVADVQTAPKYKMIDLPEPAAEAAEDISTTGGWRGFLAAS
jgi:hypothetical protein